MVRVPKELLGGLLEQLEEKGRQPAPHGLKEIAALMQDYSFVTPAKDCIQSTLEIALETFNSWNPRNAFGGTAEPSLSHVLCIEVKPKCGFLPTSGAIHPANAAKKHQSRFSMHQILKLHQVHFGKAGLK